MGIVISAVKDIIYTIVFRNGTKETAHRKIFLVNYSTVSIGQGIQANGTGINQKSFPDVSNIDNNEMLKYDVD